MRMTLTLSSVSYTQQNVMKSIFLLHKSIDISSELNTKSVRYRKVAVLILSVTLVFKIKKGRSTAKGKSGVSFNLYFVA